MTGMSQFLFVRSMIECEKVTIENQKNYPLSIGMLLYLVKHSRLDITNATRELSKAKNGTNAAFF